VAAALQPLVDLGRVEADEVSPLDVGDAPFVHEAADVADIDAEVLSESLDVEEMGELDGVGGGHGFLRSGGVALLGLFEGRNLTPISEVPRRSVSDHHHPETPDAPEIGHLRSTTNRQACR
jgi:hypothetical protein